MDDRTRDPTVAAPNFRSIALIVASAMFMEQLDGTVLTTALPAMAADLGTSAPDMSVALTAYLLSLAIFIPASGTVADRFGTKPVFRAAIGTFTLGSVLCAWAPNIAFLVAARIVQGIGGAMMMPVGRLVLLRAVDRRDLVSAMSWLLVPGMVGQIVGPPLGGFLVTTLGWRWIFYINLPIGLLGIALVSLFIRNSRSDTPPAFDGRGMLLSGAALGTLFCGFELASHPGAARAAGALVVGGLALAAVYIRYARKNPAAILDLTLMRVPSFGTSIIAGSLTRITQGAHPFLLPLMMQLGFGFSAAESGAVTAATAIGTVAMKAFAANILRRAGFRTSLVVFGVLASLGYAICAAFRPGWPVWLMFAVLLASGFCMSFQFTAYNTVAYDEIPPARMSAATSFYTTFQQLMLSGGICVAAVTLQGTMALGDHETPTFADFTIAFLVVTGLSLSATIWNLRFAPDAGREISGHRSGR